MKSSQATVRLAGQKQALTFVLVAVCIDTIGFGIIGPVMPQLIMNLTGQALSQAALYGGILFSLYAVMQFFCAPIFGNLSDRFGRRPVLLASVAAYGIDYAFMAFAPSLAWLFVGRAIAGICGASYTCATAYVADITPPEGRARAFGLIGAAWGVGFVLGPVIGGLMGELDLRLPFFAAAGLAMVNVIFGYFVLPETLKPENRRAFSLKRANPVGALLQMRQYPVVIGLLGALLFFQIAHDSLPTTWAYYSIEKFHWTTAQVGLSIGVVGLSTALMQALLVGPIVERFGERIAVHVGFLIYSLGFIAFSLAPNGWLFCTFIVPFALAGITMPALRSILSRQAPANAQGELQGAMASLQSVTAIFAPLLMTQLFRTFTASDQLYFPGAPFFTAGLCAFVGLLIVAVVLRSKRARERSEAREPVTTN